jgi:16S rRNA (guanine527-N7)-methyltransferase
MTTNPDIQTSMAPLAVMASALAAPLTNEQVAQIKQFSKLLIEWNEQVNLVGNASPQVLLEDHILDSLSLVPSIGLEKMSLIDIGCGAGFPGIPLALALPNLQVTLVEATSKKTRFLETAIDQLSLNKRITILNGRAESLAHLPHLRHQYDVATCRAVGELELVLEITLPFLKVKGRALLQRSLNQFQQEKYIAGKIVTKLGAELRETIFPDKTILAKERAIFVFEQVTASKAKYPQAWNKLKKKP